MPVQTPQWTEFLACPVCQNEFQHRDRLPVSLPCGHTICTPCLDALQWNQCPLDQSKIGMAMHQLPVNTALLKLIGNGHIPDRLRTTGELTSKEADVYRQCMKSLEALALYLKPQASNQLSRPMQRKLVILVTSQLLNDEGRTKGVRAARSVGERCVLELILQHQNPFHLSTNLWAAVRARGCQFLGPAMQEDVLKLVLNALQDGTALSRKVLVMFVVQRLVKASKTSIGHVVQLLYRASCFKVTKRDGDSSLMQLKEELRNYEDLRKEHDTQIVQIATEAGLRIGPDQWSSLLYGDYAHKSHMQSIIDKLQTPQSFSQSVQELLLALQRFGDPGNLSSLRGHFQVLTSIDPNIEPSEQAPSWPATLTAARAAEAVTAGLISFSAMNGSRRTGEAHNNVSKGPNCTFAHCTEELEFHRANNNNSTATRNRIIDRSTTTTTGTGAPRRPGTKPGGNEKGEGAPPLKMPVMTNGGKGLTLNFNDHQVQQLPPVQKQSVVIPQQQQTTVQAGQPQANKPQQQQYAVIAAVQPQQATAMRSATPQQLMAAVAAQQVVAVAATPLQQQQMQIQAASTQQLQAVAAAHQQMIGGAQLLGPGGPQDVMVINQAGAPAQVQPSQVVAMQQPTNVLGKDMITKSLDIGAADIAHMQAVAAVNHQIVVAQAAIANNQQQAAANAVAQQQIEQLQQQVAVAAANDQQQQQLSKMTNTAMSQIGLGSQQQPSAAAVSRAHMEAAVAQGQMNIAHSLAQAQAAAQSGMPVTPVLQVQQIHHGKHAGQEMTILPHYSLVGRLQEVPPGGVMTIPTQRAMPLPLQQQTQHTSVMAQIQMQNPTVSGQQQITASKISHTAAGQMFTAADGSGQQHMMMIPAAGTQMSPIVDANGAPVIDIATGQQLLAAHTPVIAAPPIQLADGTIVQNAAPIPVQSAELLGPVGAQATQLHPAGIHTLQPTPSLQDAIRRLSHDVSPEIASKSLQALEDRKEEIISELEDIVGPTAAKAIEDLTHKQAAQQKFGIGAVKQTSPAYEATLNQQQAGGVYGIWTSKPIATIASIFSSNTLKTTATGNKTTSSDCRRLDGVDDEYSPLPEGICVSRFGPISRRLNTTPGAQSVINSMPRSVSSTLTSEKTRTSDSGLTFPRASLQSDTNVTKSRFDDKVFEYNPGYYYDYIQGMDSVVMNHLTNPPLLPPSPMPPVRPVRDQFEVSISEQNYSFLAESNRIQNELQLNKGNHARKKASDVKLLISELQRRLSCLSVAENSAQMVLKRDRLAFELRMVEGGIQERHKEINIATCASDYN